MPTPMWLPKADRVINPATSSQENDDLAMTNLSESARWASHSFFYFLYVVIISLATFLSPPAPAQTSELQAFSTQISQAEQEVRTADRAFDARLDDETRRSLRASVLAAKSSAGAAMSALEEQLVLVNAKLEGLGAVEPGVVEAGDIRRQRLALNGSKSALDSAIKRGKLIQVEAQQLADEIERSQAERFSEQLSEQTASPLSPDFWRAVGRSLPRDVRRAGLFARQGGAQFRQGMAAGNIWVAVAGLLVALTILIPGQSAARRQAQIRLTRGTPGRRVRRSANALCRVLIGTVAPLLAGLTLVQGLKWSDFVSQDPTGWRDFLDAMVMAATFTGFTIAVLGALLMSSQPSWRIAPISDAAATLLHPYRLVLAAIAFVSITLDAFDRLAGLSASMTMLIQSGVAFAHLLLIIATLVAFGRLRMAPDGKEAEGPGYAGWGALSLLVWILVGVGLVALLSGYIIFSLFLVQFIAWAAVMGAAVYLLMVGLDDVATTLFDRSSRLGAALVRSFGLRGSTVDQFGVLLSGASRVALATIAIAFLFAPFGGGDGVGSLFGRLGLLLQGFEVGGVAVSPGAVIRGIIVLLIGLALVRAFSGWLDGRYLPATDLDGSSRNSVSLVARYVGIALAVIWGLASLGIGVERIALLLSALSVGIGFGLQAITQNFISGLILLAERPIKIGDLIQVGDEEGDVKRISVRSTEIELADHSTLIVPNSELITKTVLNKTLASPLGRIQIRFSTALEVDADRVRSIVLAAFAAQDAVLEQPGPAAFIDSIVDGRILFNCFAHVQTPRAAYGARSEVIAALLRDFRKEGIEIGALPAKVELVTASTDSGLE